MKVDLALSGYYFLSKKNTYIDLVVATTVFLCVTAPENEDVGEIGIHGISDRTARFWEL